MFSWLALVACPVAMLPSGGVNWCAHLCPDLRGNTLGFCQSEYDVRALYRCLFFQVEDVSLDFSFVVLCFWSEQC